jgi:hypothetical protein
MAAMLTYFSTVWAGEADPLWPHAILLSVSIIAAFTVGAGILLESPKYSAAVHRIATWLVLGGIAVESLCTIALFVFDERISGAQQSKIISLQARSWTEAQFDAIQEVKGKVTDVGVLPEKGCLECGIFAGYIEIALNAAGVKLHIDNSLELFPASGILIILPEGSDLGKNPLVIAFKNAGLTPFSKFHIRSQWSSVRTDIPVILVGEKFPQPAEFPYFPTGQAGWTELPLKNPEYVPPANR